MSVQSAMPVRMMSRFMTKLQSRLNMTDRLFAALSVLVCVTANAKTIEGEVFIVTAGGPAIKLALVQVKAISKIEMENHIAKIEQQSAPERAEADSAVSRATKEISRPKVDELMTLKENPTHGDRRQHEKQIETRIYARIQLKELRARQKTLNSAAPFFVDLPQPVATAKTDADGRFELTIPDKGEYVLVASAERTVFNDVERYFWVVRLNSEESKVTLSNDNLTSSGSPESVLA